MTEPRTSTTPAEKKPDRPSTPKPVDRFSRLLDELVAPAWLVDPWRARFMESLEPIRVEEFQEGHTLVVKAEMPGLDPEKDVEIDISDRALHIRAERRQETRTDDKGHFRSEFRYGSFSRTIPLPAGVTEDDVKATYTDGILAVRVPIDEDVRKPQKIAVTRT
jgi:HSP20 family protein